MNFPASSFLTSVFFLKVKTRNKAELVRLIESLQHLPKRQNVKKTELK